MLDYMSRVMDDWRARRLGAGGKAQEQGRRAAWPGERAGDAAEAVRRLATKAGSSCVSRRKTHPNGSGVLMQMLWSQRSAPSHHARV